MIAAASVAARRAARSASGSGARCQVWRDDAAREAVAGLGRRIGDHRTALEPAQRLQRDQLGIARPDAESVGGAAHLVAAHWVTGSAGRQARWLPTGSAWVTA